MPEFDSRAADGKRITDKIGIVTSAGQGIGRAATKRLGAEGAKPVGVWFPSGEIPLGNHTA
jgi:NAD(P)-dependent dehydrogenase (short-subunit alcohol dehydrogenase family)